MESGPFWVKYQGVSEAILDPAQTSFRKFRDLDPNSDLLKVSGVSRREEDSQREQEGPVQTRTVVLDSAEPVKSKKKTSLHSRKRSADTLLKASSPDTKRATDDNVSFPSPFFVHSLALLIDFITLYEACQSESQLYWGYCLSDISL